jgi:hypothetical protein
VIAGPSSRPSNALNDVDSIPTSGGNTSNSR